MRDQMQIRRGRRGRGAVLLLAALAACDTTKAPATLEGDRLVDHPQIIAEGDLDVGLWYAGEFVEPATATRPMRVAVKVRNIEDYALHVQYQFEFKDKNDLPLKSQTGWQFKTLPPRIEQTLQGSAMELSAVNWQLRIRPGQ